MNSPENKNQDQITVNFNVQISISREDLQRLLIESGGKNLLTSQYPAPNVIPENIKNQRLAYTMQETAKILGVSYITVHRLIKRKHLKCTASLRRKIIPAFEIERFLRETLE